MYCTSYQAVLGFQRLGLQGSSTSHFHFQASQSLLLLFCRYDLSIRIPQWSHIYPRFRMNDSLNRFSQSFPAQLKLMVNLGFLEGTPVDTGQQSASSCLAGTRCCPFAAAVPRPPGACPASPTPHHCRPGSLCIQLRERLSTFVCLQELNLNATMDVLGSIEFAGHNGLKMRIPGRYGAHSTRVVWVCTLFVMSDALASRWPRATQHHNSPATLGQCS